MARHVLVHVFALVVAVLDDCVHEVVLVHRDRHLQDRGHVNLAVVDLVGRAQLLAVRELDGVVHGAVGERLDGLVDGHGLLARGDSLHGVELRVLARDEHLADQARRFEGRDRAARRAVVRGHDGLDVAVRARDGVLRQAQSLVGLPLLGELVGDDLHVAAVNRRLEDVHLPLAQEQGVVVGGRSADEDVVAFGHVLERVVGLHLAHLLDLVRDVEVNVGVADEAVVGDDGDALAVRVLDDGGSDLAVVRRDDQNVHALRQKVVALLGLHGVVAVGDLHVELRADLFGPRFHQRLVALPALLLERVHREADVDGFARLLHLPLVAAARLTLLRPA